jgi:hypothetical protein
VALALIGLKIRKVRDDGNCLFHALADQIWSDPSRHAELRAAVCAELLTNRACVTLFLFPLLACAHPPAALMRLSLMPITTFTWPR